VGGLLEVSALKAILIKELKIEFRNKQMINSYMILAIMIMASFRFAFLSIDISFTKIAAPVLWITFFFSGMFSFATSYKREVEQGTRDGLILAPISCAAIFFGKFLTNLLMIFILEMFSLVLFFVFFPVAVPDAVGLLAIIIAGTIGFAALGNIISAISANVEQSSVMVPVLLVPILLFTVVMSSVSGTAKLFAGGGFLDIQDEIKFVLAFDLIFVGAGYLLIDRIMAE